jgi:Putative peptidoglycan binding domain
VGAALGAIALVVVAIGAIISAELPSSSQGAGRVASTSGAATVQRRDLIATDTESGTLGYADPETVFNRLSGTVTSLPAVGDVVKPGQALYRVDGAPVVLFDGAVPAYRDLLIGVSAGADVTELKRNLVDLGFDPGHQITINDAFDAATTAAVQRWQASLGQSQTGTVTLGQVVFLPGAQRVSSVGAALGSNGGSSASGSGATAATGASATVVARPEFVALTTPSPAATTTTQTTTTTTSTAPTTTTQATTTPSPTSPSGRPGSGSKPSVKAPTSDAILLALLKAEIVELKKELAAGGGSSRSAAVSSGGGGSGGSSGGGGGRSSGSGAAGASAGTSAGTSAGASGASASASGSSGATAQPILQTTSNKLVVTVNLDATKQSEAVVGQPVSVQLPSGVTVGGRITAVSSVAQSTSSSASSSSAASGSGTGSGSSAPSATIPVTIDVTGPHRLAGLDQAAVSVNFEQQVQRNVLSVPVSALLATAGGGYAIQEVPAPHRLIPVTPGLFAAGFVQISGAQIVPGLQVTDSQG